MPVLTSLISSSCGVASPSVLGLDHALDRAVGVAHDAPVAARVLEHRRRHRRRRAALRRARRPARAIASALTSGTSPLSTTTGASLRARRRRRRARRSPPRPRRRCRSGCWLHRQLHALGQHRLERALRASRRRRPAPAPASSAARTGHSTIGSPHSSCSTFGVLRAHARALARGEDQDGGRAHRADASSHRRALARGVLASEAGGQGFEPRFSGPKPDVLPLDDPPRGSDIARTQTHGSAGAVRAQAQLTRARIPCVLQGCLHSVRRQRQTSGAIALSHCRAAARRWPRSRAALLIAAVARLRTRVAPATASATPRACAGANLRPTRRQRGDRRRGDAVPDQPICAAPTACGRCGPTANCRRVAVEPGHDDGRAATTSPTTARPGRRRWR